MKSVLGKAFKKEAKMIMEYLAGVGEEKLAELEKGLTKNRYTCSAQCYMIQHYTKLNSLYTTPHCREGKVTLH